jgi:hypothetical protein
MSQPDYVRVKSKDTGHELSVPVSHFDANEDAYTLLENKPATDSASDALPPKYKTTVAEATASKRTTPKKRAATRKKTTAAPAAADQSGQPADPQKENS